MSSALNMMRFQRLSPDILPLTNGRKPSLESDCSAKIIPNITSLAAKSLKPRSNQSPIRDHNYFSNFNCTAQADTPTGASPNKPHNDDINGVSRGDVLLQWGHNKRSRGARAESRGATLSPGAGGEQKASLHSRRRQMVKVQRRSAIAAAEKVAAVTAAMAMPPPRGSSCNLKPSLVCRDSDVGNRTIEDRSGGLTRSDKRSPQKPTSNCLTSEFIAMNPDSKQQPSDQETGGSGAATTEKINLDRFEWPRIYLSLSRKEKEDDFLAMKGTKLPQRPKKRAKNVDKTLQYCFPGMWLSDLTRSRYEVREKKCVKKRKRGLKGMESMDSDSE